MSNEESRLQVMGTTNPVKPAYVAILDRECFNCGEKRQLSYNFLIQRTVVVVVVHVEVIEVVVEAVVEVVVILVQIWLHLRKLCLSL
jgi:hypothetical protein